VLPIRHDASLISGYDTLHDVYKYGEQRIAPSIVSSDDRFGRESTRTIGFQRSPFNDSGSIESEGSDAIASGRRRIRTPPHPDAAASGRRRIRTPPSLAGIKTNPAGETPNGG